MKLVRLLVLFFSITTYAQHVNVVPQPLSVEMGNGFFTITPRTKIIAASSSAQNANYLQDVLASSLGEFLTINDKGSKGIILQLDPSLESELGEEGYFFTVAAKKIAITAATNSGVFYGIQTLRQLLPEATDTKNKSLAVAHMHIKDKPRFGWRSFMLDESRYFKGMDQVKKILDQMALLKMNVFHWHLTDDQGWRIEIKKYPKLTEVGAFRKDSQIGGWNSEKRSNEPHGGFYTQEQIKELIAYATKRQITIIPEIEMPGHASAAIAAYPWLGTIGELKEVPVVFGKLPDSYDVSSPKVYAFLEDVLTEVMELFPGKIIHIGGDEVKFDAWKDSKKIQDFMVANALKTPADLQIFFTNKISAFIDSKAHRMMGWNEILGGNVHEWQKSEDVKVEEKLANSAIIHFWKGNLDLVNDAVTSGYDIVNSLHSSTYLDYSYTAISLEKAYSFNPIPEGLDPKYHAKVLGLGCQMWGEWIPTVAAMDQMVFPRLAAFAEVGWTATERKNFEVFTKNLQPILQRWQKAGIGYAKE